jgi:hypothetical protein
MTGLIWTKEFLELRSDISGSPYIYFITFDVRQRPWALLVSRVEPRLCLCADRLSVLIGAQCFTMPTSYCAASCERVTVHCTTYGQFQCLVLRIVSMFDSYFSLSDLFLADFSVTASRTTDHVVPAHSWVMTTFVPFQVWCFLTPWCFGSFPPNICLQNSAVSFFPVVHFFGEMWCF